MFTFRTQINIYIRKQPSRWLILLLISTWDSGKNIESEITICSNDYFDWFRGKYGGRHVCQRYCDMVARYFHGCQICLMVAKCNTVRKNSNKITNLCCLYVFYKKPLSFWFTYNYSSELHRHVEDNEKEITFLNKCYKILFLRKL